MSFIPFHVVYSTCLTQKQQQKTKPRKSNYAYANRSYSS